MISETVFKLFGTFLNVVLDVGGKMAESEDGTCTDVTCAPVGPT